MLCLGLGLTQTREPASTTPNLWASSSGTCHPGLHLWGPLIPAGAGIIMWHRHRTRPSVPLAGSETHSCRSRRQDDAKCSTFERKRMPAAMPGEHPPQALCASPLMVNSLSQNLPVILKAQLVRSQNNIFRPEELPSFSQLRRQRSPVRVCCRFCCIDASCADGDRSASVWLRRPISA
jgi:hypothetical protein